MGGGHSRPGRIQSRLPLSARGEIVTATFACTAVDRLPSAPDGWHAVDYMPLCDGSLACLQATTDVPAIVRDNHDLVSKGLFDQQMPYLSADSRARLLKCGDADPLAEFPLEYPFPAFDRLPDGGWIVVNTRCHRGEPNALTLTAGGRVVRRFLVGDGVRQVQADDVGGVWVSHFDEGIFGDALGAAGIARFDPSGRETWRANDDRSLPSVDDCYALNAIGGEAWACYYSDFPILRVRRSGEYRVWTNSVGGAAAIAVDGDWVVLFGGYDDQRSRIALLKLGEKAAEWVGELTLTETEVARDQAVGRGDAIHLIGEGTWRRFTVAEVVKAVTSASDTAVLDQET